MNNRDELYHYSYGSGSHRNKDELYHYSRGSSLRHNGDELYHYGVAGMKWGQRKRIIRNAHRQAGKNASYYTKERAANKALAADTVRRVKKYGAKKVKSRNRWRNAGTVAGAAVAVGVLSKFGSRYPSGSLGRIAAGAAAVGVTVKATKKVSARHKENKTASRLHKKYSK